jgi:hypothetical protein
VHLGSRSFGSAVPLRMRESLEVWIGSRRDFSASGMASVRVPPLRTPTPDTRIPAMHGRASTSQEGCVANGDLTLARSIWVPDMVVGILSTAASGRCRLTSDLF